MRDVKYLTGKEIFCVNTSAHPAWGFPKAAITWDGKTYGFVFGFRMIVTSWLFYFCTDGNIYVTRYTNSSTWNTWRKFASTEEVEVSEAPTA